MISAKHTAILSRFCSSLRSLDFCGEGKTACSQSWSILSTGLDFELARKVEGIAL
jgi:hypothetical protein